MRRALLLLSVFLGLTSAQSLGPTKEVHPKIKTYKCTKKHGCKAQNSFIVLDELSRPLYQKNNPSLSCGVWGSAPNTTVCPDAKSCLKNCVVDGISDYAQYGVKTKGDALYMDMLRDSDLSVLTPRVYLMDTDEHKYDMLKLTGGEFSFDVDVSKLPCGMNGALYLAEMDKYGGKNSLNKAGARLGSGYCDAQCYTFPIVDGVGNIEGKGACCNELDIWEANSRTTSIAPHPCNITSAYQCTGDECAFDGVCDKWGCGQNPYLAGNHNYYGRGNDFKVDTKRPFTVVTSFPKNRDGKLDSIHRLYIQGGKVIQNAVVNVTGQKPINYMDDEYCEATGGAARFLALGAMEKMGEALSRGMVLTFAIWWDESGFMQWMDGGSAGPCNTTEGSPASIRVIQPDTAVTFSNMKWGEIGSTYKL